MDSLLVNSMSTSNSTGDIQSKQSLSNLSVASSLLDISSGSTSTLPAMGTGTMSSSGMIYVGGGGGVGVELGATTTSTGGSGSEKNNNNNNNNGANLSKLQALKQRKIELEKLLNEKNALLQKIQKQESQIISGTFDGRNLIVENGTNNNNNHTILRRKVGTSFKLPKNLLQNKDEKDIEKLLSDKKSQQDICNVSLRLSNDSTLSKSMRRAHKAEYEAAQQRLMAINQNLSMMKKRQLTKSTSESTSTGNLSPQFVQRTNTKQSQQQHYRGEPSSGLATSHNYGSNNSVNNNYPTTQKIHRSDYDLNVVYSPPPQQQHHRHAISTYSQPHFDYVYQQSSIDNYAHQFDTLPLNNNSKFPSNRQSLNLTPTTPILSDKYYLSPTQQQYDDTGFIKSSQNIRQFSKMSLNGSSSDDVQQYGGGGGLLLAERNRFSQGSLNKSAGSLGSTYHQNSKSVSNAMNRSNLTLNLSCNENSSHVDTLSLSPSSSSTMRHTDQQPLTPAGLGGYWRILSNNERVWCAFDSSNYEAAANQAAFSTKPRKLNASISDQSLKSASLSNFDTLITLKDDDRISVSSMLSESNKKPKEKQWLETSLDGPIIRTKIPSSCQLSPDTVSIQTYNYSVGGAHSLCSPTTSRATSSRPDHPPHNPKLHAMYRGGGDKAKLSSQSMSSNSNSYRVPGDPSQYLSQSTSYLNIEFQPHHHHHHHHSPASSSHYHSMQEATTTSEDVARKKAPAPPAAHLKPPARTPTTTNDISSSSTTPTPTTDIRIESPKNMTVIQQATFMPYKEVTKPFEMSDFYKYSTKFRQKETTDTPAPVLNKQPMPLPTD